MSLLRLAACSALVGLASAHAAAQRPPTGAVAGRVVTRGDGGAAEPARAAGISVTSTPLRGTTDDDGRFLLAAVPAGAATLRVRLLGYAALEQAIRVSAGETLHVHLTLEPEARLLSPVRTDAPTTDVEMFVSKPNVATVTLGAAAMAGVPSVGEPDVARVVQLLPGVVARNDYNTGLNVRGGEADQNLILLDGYPIYNPFHLGGLFSTFMDATVGGIQLTTGAFPARYGGRLSSVLDVRSAEETRAGLHGSADVSALGATGRLSGTLGSGRGAWSVAGRRTYADAAVSLFTDNFFPYHFRDFHGRITYAFATGVRLAVTGYVGRDVLDANLAAIESDRTAGLASEGRWAFDWGNRVLGATIARDVGRSATLEQRISASSFSTVLDLGGGASVQSNSIADLRLGGSLAARGAAHDRSIGYELATSHVRYASASPQTGTSDFDLVQRPMSGALWVEDLWRASSRWLVESGLRAEALSGRNWAGLSPRLSLKFFPAPSLALTAGVGRVTQWTHSLAGDGAMRYFELWLASDSSIPVATAWHGIAGAERRVGRAGSVRVETYVKRYDRLLEANWSEDPQRRGDELFAAQGVSYGADLLARWQPQAGPAGWLSYSYARSSRSRGGVRWTPGHDRRHDLDVVVTVPVAGYRLGGRFGWASGTPYTPIVGQVVRRIYDPARDRWGTGDPRIFIESIGGARNSARFPATHRLDLDVSRELRVRGATVAPYVSVVNAYNAKNVFVYLYDYSTDRPTRRAISQFPIIPSGGVRVAF